jgi:SAM-dependent methyltransferase
MQSNDLAYFNQDIVWQSALDFWELECVELIKLLWPTDAQSLLDAGCGAGRLLNNLDLPVLKVGTDFAVTALLQVNAPVAAATITAMPIRDGGFDLTLCSNVLEHLSHADLPLACAELERISAKYVMIVSPIDEPLETQLTVCRRCACQFHPNGHRHRFGVADFERMLPSFETQTVRYFGDGWLAISPLAGAIDRATGGDFHFFPGATCPNCNHIMTVAEARPPDSLSVIEAFSDRPSAPASRPASAIVLLKRRKERATDEPVGSEHISRLMIEFDNTSPFRAVEATRVSAGKANLSTSIAYTPVAMVSRGKPLMTSGTGWLEPMPSADGHYTRWLKAEDEAQVEGFVAFNASVVSGHLTVRYADHCESPVDVALFDGILGYVSVGTVGGANDGSLREARFKIPVSYLPQRSSVLVRLIVPPGRPGRGLIVTDVGFHHTEQMTRAVPAPNVAHLIEGLLGIADDVLVLYSDDASMSVSLDARLLGCRTGRLDFGRGRRVEVPVWASSMQAFHAQAPEPQQVRQTRVATVIGATFLKAMQRSLRDGFGEDSRVVASHVRTRIADTVAIHGAPRDVELVEAVLEGFDGDTLKRRGVVERLAAAHQALRLLAVAARASAPNAEGDGAKAAPVDVAGLDNLLTELAALQIEAQRRTDQLNVMLTERTELLTNLARAAPERTNPALPSNLLALAANLET